MRGLRRFEGALGGRGAAGTAAVRAALNNEVLPRHLGNLDRLAAAAAAAPGSGGWLAGTAEPTICDFVLACSLKDLTSGAVDGIEGETLLAPFPALRRFLERFVALPAVAQWRARCAEAGCEAQL